ncbi:hypothetical protein THIOSC15_1910001 [uncultured Thiomicrorhabdus sp.]
MLMKLTRWDVLNFAKLKEKFYKYININKKNNLITPPSATLPLLKINTTHYKGILKGFENERFMFLPCMQNWL